jgi:sugar phosphate isomerase/epimerase
MMYKAFNRRQFTKALTFAGLTSISLPFKVQIADSVKENNSSTIPGKLKLSLNAYSFDKPLRGGKFTLSDLLEYCAKVGFEGVDLTGYYFPGYPSVPDDEYIYNVKKKAFRLGVGISGTGVRNDFSWADPVKRIGEKNLVKDWIIVAEKLGAPLVRIFTGASPKDNYTWEQRAKWIADDINECAEFGKKHGVMLGIQNHNDFVKSSSDIENLFKLLNSEWVGLLIDIGSYHTPDPYKDIAINSKHAISWQLKERVFVNDSQVDTDFSKIVEIVKQCGYSGYLPIESLGEGDSALKAEMVFKKVKAVLNS